jgi:hypothetical protein
VFLREQMTNKGYFTYKKGVWYKDRKKLNILEGFYLHFGLAGLIKEKELRDKVKKASE